MSDNRHGQRWTSADTHGRSAAGHARYAAGSARLYLASGRRGQRFGLHSSSQRDPRLSATPALHLRCVAEFSRTGSRRRLRRRVRRSPRRALPWEARPARPRRPVLEDCRWSIGLIRLWPFWRRCAIGSAGLGTVPARRFRRCGNDASNDDGPGRTALSRFRLRSTDAKQHTSDQMSLCRGGEAR
jgi:hypothetical protein